MPRPKSKAIVFHPTEELRSAINLAHRTKALYFANGSAEQLVEREMCRKGDVPSMDFLINIRMRKVTEKRLKSAMRLTVSHHWPGRKVEIPKTIPATRPAQPKKPEKRPSKMRVRKRRSNPPAEFRVRLPRRKAS